MELACEFNEQRRSQLRHLVEGYDNLSSGLDYQRVPLWMIYPGDQVDAFSTSLANLLTLLSIELQNDSLGKPSDKASSIYLSVVLLHEYLKPCQPICSDISCDRFAHLTWRLLQVSSCSPCSQTRSCFHASQPFLSIINLAIQAWPTHSI